MRIVEIILYIIFAFALIFKINHYPGGSILAIIPLMLLSIQYFAFGFLIFNGIRFRDLFKKDTFKGVPALKIIGAVAFGLSLSPLIIGILFSIQHYPGAKIQLIVGFASTIICIAIYSVKALSGQSSFIKRNFLRMIMPLSLGFLFLTFSAGDIEVYRQGGRNKVEDDIIRNRYDHPNDIEALFAYDSINAIHNPHARSLESLRQERDIRKAMEQ